MKIYVAIVDDRHADTDAEVFTDPLEAIKFSREYAHLNAREYDVEEEENPEWVYYVRYSDEGDCTWVIEKELHESSR